MCLKSTDKIDEFQIRKSRAAVEHWTQLDDKFLRMSYTVPRKVRSVGHLHGGPEQQKYFPLCLQNYLLISVRPTGWRKRFRNRSQLSYLFIILSWKNDNNRSVISCPNLRSAVVN